MLHTMLTLSVLASVATVASSKCSRYKKLSLNSATLSLWFNATISVAGNQAQKRISATLATLYTCYTSSEPSLQAGSYRFRPIATLATLSSLERRMQCQSI